jgi:hypothetical protein
MFTVVLPYRLPYAFYSQADKFCLMRIWGWTPFIGSELARFSRRYFFSACCLALAFVSAYAWAQFPYDNLCDIEEYKGRARSGTYTNVTMLNKTVVSEIVVEQTAPVLYCSQSWRNVRGLSFPPTSRIQPDGKVWMSDSQERLTDMYGYSALAILIGFIVFFFGHAIKQYILSFFRGVWRARGQSQKIDFSSNAEIFAYIPQVKLVGYPFPFLACNIGTWSLLLLVVVVLLDMGMML